MSSTSTVLLVGALFCVLMLLVLSSLLKSGVPGIRSWCAANLIGAMALVLYAFGRQVPPLIGYEVANGLYAGAAAAMFAGYRRFFGMRAPWPWLAAGIGATVAAIAWFHYVHNSFAARTATVAAFQAAICVGIALTVLRNRPRWRVAFPYYFAAGVAGAVAVGHTVRTLIYFFNTGEITSLLQPSGWNLFFVAAGTFVLPALSIGPLIMVHDAMVGRAETAANRDFLTGAWSRRAFVEHAEREIARALRGAHPLTLVTLDVDHFKKINDHWGHEIGDQVLVDVVARVHAEVRNVDFFARLGGEEFGLLLPDTGIDAAMVVAERLRLALDRELATAPERDSAAGLHYTVSMGVATLEPDEDLLDLMRCADRALYQAKRSGRNQAVRAPVRRTTVMRAV